MRITYFWIVIVIIKHVYMLENTTVSPQVTSKHKDDLLVEMIKKNLRRNNDDYLDTTAVNHRFNTATELISNTVNNETSDFDHHESKEIKDARKYNTEIDIRSDDIQIGGRRQMPNFGKKKINMLLPEVNKDFINKNKSPINIQSKQLLTTKAKKPNQNLHLIKSRLTTLTSRTASTSTKSIKRYSPTINKNTQSPLTVSIVQTVERMPNYFTKKVHRNRANDFEHFVRKNKYLLRNFIRQRKATKKKLVIGDIIRTKAEEQMQEMLRQKRNMTRLAAKSDMELPSGHLLDMAPAKGGRVSFQRLSGRLCHRHVLMPEGPKYNSRGMIYVPAHDDVLMRPYNVTARPNLLLPKCCNCCKKSVLGCQ